MKVLERLRQPIGIRQQISLVLIIGVFSLSIISAFVMSSIAEKNLDTFLLEQTESAAHHYASESKTSLQNKSLILEDSARLEIMHFPHVVGVKVSTLEGKIIYKEGLIGYSDDRIEKVIKNIEENSEDGRHEYFEITDELAIFIRPVYATYAINTQHDHSTVANNEANEVLGYVEITMDKSTLATLSQSIYHNSIMVSSIATIILLALLLSITQLVTDPIRKLSAIMNEAEQGDTSVRANLAGSKEILKMETAFNTMMTTLESREEELKRARDTALASARLKGQFATTVSHELRTPLNGVMGMLELLNSMQLNEEQQEYVNIARTSGEELLLLIDDILDFSKIESGKLKLQLSQFDPQDMVRNITELLTPQAQLKNISLTYEIDKDAQQIVAGDTGRIRQILLNLVGNAIKFTHHGSIKISIKNEETDADAQTPTQQFLRFTVTDSGIGIPYHAQQMIFEAFSQADGSTTRQFGGTGLGLAISSQLVELMGGKIGVKSEPDKGSQFWFTLPIRKYVAPLIATETPQELMGLRILIASRTTASCHALLNVFSGWNAQQSTTTNTEEALAMLREAVSSGCHYNFVVIDSPIADGDELALVKAICEEPELQGTFTVLLSHTLQKELPANSICLKKNPSDKLLEETFLKAIAGPKNNESGRVSGLKGGFLAHVLIVEDNQTNQLVAKRMIEKLGCSCVVAENGNFAISALEKESFDIVLMDCNMPYMNGYTASQLIRGKKSRYQEVPIIALTATTNQLDINRCYTAGMNDYLSKPLKLESLQRTLNKYVVPTDTSHHPITSQLQHSLADLSKVDTGLTPLNDLNGDTASTSFGHLLGKSIGSSTMKTVHSPADTHAIAQTLDKSVLENLENQLGSAYNDYIDSYLHDTPIYIENLRAAVKDKHFDQIKYFSHLIKGSSGNLGARQLAALCQKLEVHDHNDAPGTVHAMLSDICIEFKNVISLLADPRSDDLSDIDKNEDESGIIANKPCILIADDDNSSRIIMRSILEKDGYAIKEAHNGAEALQFCQEKMPDLILMDAMMPVMDGFIASERIMALDGQHYPTILMITALTDEGTLERAFAAGATDFILKPINMTVLRQRVSRVLHTGNIDRHIHQLSNYDNLTSLPNRSFFIERSKKLLHIARENNEKMAVIFLDLDRFKLINDSKGHDAGDILLKNFAKRLESCVRSVDIVARLGGDEFTVVLNDIQSTEDAIVVANKILDSLLEPIDAQERQIQISTSIGIAIFPEDGETINELMKHADTAMFQAKAKGGKAFEFYHEGMELEINKQIELEIEIREALEKNEFELYYQPQVSLKTGELTGLEALIRWNHPTRGFVPPVEFIPFAEKSNLITQIGDWVLTHACKQQGIWLANGYDPVPIAVNVSGGELADSVLLSEVENALLHNNIPASLIKLEITEDTLADCDEQTTQHLHDLRGLGTNLAIDDFGTGYSSLSYLKMFPVDTLKIDRSFVKDLPEDSNSAAIVSGIIALGHSLKLVIVAEGVETEAQREFLAREGCDIMQGYFLSKPLPIAELEEWIIHEHAHPGYLLDKPKAAATATPRVRPPL